MIVAMLAWHHRVEGQRWIEVVQPYLDHIDSEC